MVVPKVFVGARARIATIVEVVRRPSLMPGTEHIYCSERAETRNGENWQGDPFQRLGTGVQDGQRSLSP